jgi:hypothetical protein
MSCFVNRWGPGTTCEKPVNSESAKELRMRVEKMNTERAKQDSMWKPLVSVTESSSGSPTVMIYTSKDSLTTSGK